MAEDAVPKCKRGHPRTPENVGTDRSCKTCRAADSAPLRPAYRATPGYWQSQRRYKLKGNREAIQAELDALREEETECLKLLAQAMRTK